MRGRCYMAFVCLSLLLLPFAGCEDEQVNQTVRGLQEENRVLKEEIVNLKQRLEQAKDESRESQMAIAERYKQKLSDVESKLAALRLELGSIQREKLALEDLVESAPRAQMAKDSRFMAERLVYFGLIGIAVFLAVLFGLKWKRANDRLQQLVMEEVSDLRRIGAQQ